MREFTCRHIITDKVDEFWDIYERELLKYAFECFMKGEYIIVSKECVFYDHEVIIKMSYIDEEYVNLFKNDRWSVFNFSEWKFNNWLTTGCIPSDRTDEYLKIFESKNLV